MEMAGERRQQESSEGWKHERADCDGFEGWRMRTMRQGVRSPEVENDLG